MSNLMDNAHISEIFARIASLTQLKGENVFIVRAYQRAARTIKELPVELEQYVREGGRLQKIDDIGEAIASKITEVLDTGQLGFYEKLKAEFPPGLLEVMEIPGVGPKTAALAWGQLGVTTVQELESAIEDGRFERLPRMGHKQAQNILSALRASASGSRVPNTVR
jgi:DNA polymerase (family 10)